MRFLHLLTVGLVACIPLAPSPTAMAQVAPGIVVPATKLDGFVQSHLFACILASAGRPVAGLNMEAPELMGEGLSVEEAAPEWLTSAIELDSDANFSRLETGEGDVWIIFDKVTSSCMLAAEVTDAEGFRASFEDKFYSGSDWKKMKNRTAVGYYYQMKLAGLKFKSTFPDLAGTGGVFAVHVSTK